MRTVNVIILLSSVAWAQEQAANQDDKMTDKLVDQLIDRLFSRVLRTPSAMSQGIGLSRGYRPPRQVIARQQFESPERKEGETKEEQTERVFGKTIVATGRYVDKGYVTEKNEVNLPVLLGGVGATAGIAALFSQTGGGGLPFLPVSGEIESLTEIASRLGS